MHGFEVRKRTFKVTSPLMRWVFVIALAFSSPAVQDALTDLTMWATGEACCADDCDETGSPCTQQCVHCPCGNLRSVTLQSSTTELVAPIAHEVMVDERLSPPSDAMLDPPFRPPVS